MHRNKFYIILYWIILITPQLASGSSSEAILVKDTDGTLCKIEIEELGGEFSGSTRLVVKQGSSLLLASEPMFRLSSIEPVTDEDGEPSEFFVATVNNQSVTVYELSGNQLIDRVSIVLNVRTFRLVYKMERLATYKELIIQLVRRDICKNNSSDIGINLTIDDIVEVAFRSSVIIQRKAVIVIGVPAAGQWSLKAVEVD